MRALNACGKSLLAGVAALATLATLGTAHARISVLYAFKGGSDGAYPWAGLIEDSAGNLYSTTRGGGGRGCGAQGCGTVFRLAPDGTETVLHAFHGQKHGISPEAGLIADKAGNLYGTTNGGGSGCFHYGCGTVFKVAPNGTETVLYSFEGNDHDDGTGPQAPLIENKAGNLYGTTSGGGGTGCSDGFGCGTVFKLAPDGTETVLHAFAGGNDGANPLAGVIEGEAGDFYGTTMWGGGEGCDYVGFSGCGTVFKVAPNGTETVLYSFAGGSDGANPYAGLIQDKAGNLYGTTNDGGIGCKATNGCGTVFKLAPDGTETVLHAFAGGSDGAYPWAGLIRDEGGNLYGTTAEGGGRGCHNYLYHGCGTIFRLAPDGAETVLYAFSKLQRHGALPYAGLMKGGDGQLYGTASEGGDTGCSDGCGIVFSLRK